jgi:hypothetical protein
MKGTRSRNVFLALTRREKRGLRNEEKRGNRGKGKRREDKVEG